MDRSRREEARAARDEIDLISRDRAREERLKEREERATAREEAVLRQHLAEEQVKWGRDRRKEGREREGAETDSDSEDNVPTNGKTSGTVTPKTTAGEAKSNGGGRWELSCEICRKTGWNLVSYMTLLGCVGASC